MNRAPLLLLPLALAACDRSADRGTQVTFNAADGQVRAAVGGNGGGLKVDLPGFKGEIKLPKVDLDAGNFELNGVHLYPGSRIENVDIRGGDAGAGGNLRLRFTSPADPATLRDWYRERLGKAGFTLRSDGLSLVGQDNERKPFRMDLTPAAEGATGTIVVGG